MLHIIFQRVDKRAVEYVPDHPGQRRGMPLVRLRRRPVGVTADTDHHDALRPQVDGRADWRDLAQGTVTIVGIADPGRGQQGGNSG